MIEIPEVKLPDPEAITADAAEALKGAQELAANAWEEFSENEAVSGVVNEAQRLANNAWDAAEPAVEASANAVSEGARDVVYVGGRAVLGVAKLGENAYKTVAVLGERAVGDGDAAVQTALSSEVDKAVDSWGEIMGVDDTVKAVGDGAEIVGEVAAGVGAVAVAVALAPESAAAAAAGAATVGVDALFALDVAGEVLEAEAADGVLTDEETLIATGAGVATGAFAHGAGKVIGKVTSEVAPTVSRLLGREAAETAGRETAIATEEAASDVAATEAKELGENARYIICPNESLAGTIHPITGVKFERKIIIQESGEAIEGVFPRFESSFDAKIPKELYLSTNETQFKECNAQLLRAIEDDSELAEKFTAEQIEQIREGVIDGSTPDGFVWHHNEEEGVIQLVDRVTHERTKHMGGKAIWGGGY